MKAATQERIATMAKSLPTTSARQYGTVISIKRGEACITDGFGLMLFKSPDLVEAKVLSKNLMESPVKFPNYARVLKPKGQAVDGPVLLQIIRGLRRARPIGADKLWLRIDTDGQVNLGIGEGPGDNKLFNPFILTNFLAGIPAKVHKSPGKVAAWLSPDGDCLTLQVDEYEITAVRLTFEN